MPPMMLKRVLVGIVYGCSTWNVSWYSVQPTVGSSGQFISTIGPTAGP